MILTGDCRELLRTLPDQSVHCCVTSPPYFGLRDYGTAGQIGLEPTPDEYVAQMVAVFREVRRVLRDDGTLWLNLGDSYSSGGRTTQVVGTLRGATSRNIDGDAASGKQEYLNGTAMRPPVIAGLASKQLLGIPWRVAFALQADGWWLRQDIIWSKPNPMPESVSDRCTKAHEYLFLLSKSAQYFYDAAAIAEPVATSQIGRVRNDVFGGKSWKERQQHSKGGTYETKAKPIGRSGADGGSLAFAWQSSCGERRETEGREALQPQPEMARPNDMLDGATRNRRSVWEVTTQSFSEAHFATFPPALIEPCIKAGCPADGTVLDPFGGAGTTGLVADRLQRNAILIELNPEYAEMAKRRIYDDAPLLSNENLMA